MPKFNKRLDQLETRFDKWLYVIRNLNKLDRIPDELRENIFSKFFELAEIAKFTPQQVRNYEDSLKSYRDIKNSIDTAREEGLLEGEMKGKIEGKIEGEKNKALEVARKAISKGMSLEDVIDLTGLSKDEIMDLM